MYCEGRTRAHLLDVRRREPLHLAHVGDGAPPGARQRVRRAQRPRQARVGREGVQQLHPVPLLHVDDTSKCVTSRCDSAGVWLLQPVPLLHMIIVVSIPRLLSVQSSLESQCKTEADHRSGASQITPSVALSLSLSDRMHMCHVSESARRVRLLVIR